MRVSLPRFEFRRGGSFNPPGDGATFEQLARDLFARLLGDAHADRHGRNGQAQAGIDIIGVDHGSGRRIGIQCKLRSGGASAARVTEAELLHEVAQARTLVPPIDAFVLLTTGPNDTKLKQVAAELSQAHAEGLFSVEFHGWDWIEALLDQHVDLAVRYGLVAVVHPADPVPSSRIAAEIGVRLANAVTLMNAGRDPESAFTFPGLARYAGHADWRRLEQIVEGRGDADEVELLALSEALGLNAGWLIEGKGTPFGIDNHIGHRRVEEIFDAIVAMEPQRIVFVRQREGGEGHHDAFIAVERDDVRWYVFRDTHPACDRVGGGGSHDLFALCRLMRRFDHEDVAARVLCHGRHLDSPLFEQVLEGEVYPGAILSVYRHDRWWEGFAALRTDWLEGEEVHWVRLRNAVAIVKHQLARARSGALTSRYRRDALAWGRFLPTKPRDAEAGEPWP